MPAVIAVSPKSQVPSSPSQQPKSPKWEQGQRVGWFTAEWVIVVLWWWFDTEVWVTVNPVRTWREVNSLKVQQLKKTLSEQAASAMQKHSGGRLKLWSHHKLKISQEGSLSRLQLKIDGKTVSIFFFSLLVVVSENRKCCRLDTDGKWVVSYHYLNRVVKKKKCWLMCCQREMD